MYSFGVAHEVRIVAVLAVERAVVVGVGGRMHQAEVVTDFVGDRIRIAAWLA